MLNFKLISLIGITFGSLIFYSLYSTSYYNDHFVVMRENIISMTTHIQKLMQIITNISFQSSMLTYLKINKKTESDKVSSC